MNKEQTTSGIPQTPIRFLLYVSRPHLRWAVLAIMLVTVAQILSSSLPFILRELVDGFTMLTTVGEQVDLFLFWGVVYIMVLTISFIAWRLSGFIGMEWLTRANATAYERLYDYVSHHSSKYFSDRFAGSISNKVSHASDGVEHILERSLWGWYGELLSLFVSSALLFTVHYSLAVSFVIVFVALFVMNMYLVQKRRPHVVAYSAASSKLRGEGVDFLTNIAAVRQYARRSFEARRIFETITFRRIKDVYQWRLGEWATVANNIATILLIGGILLAVFSMFKNGSISAGDVVLVLVVLNRVVHIITFMGNMMNGFIRMYGEVEEGLTDTLRGHEVTDSPNAVVLNVKDGAIQFRSVSFSYEDEGVFKEFGLEIEAGQRVGFVGHSGAGKTTLVSLLLRQHDIDGGEILIDGQNIAEVTQDSLRESIAVVPQDPALFHRTLWENIAYGKPDATDSEIEGAARMAEAHEFINNLPKGYDTLVGERGVKLSGGQRQRVAIARAILKNAPILLLDEATSSLDSESEGAIQEALQKLMEGKTVVAIAHRLSTLRKMDRIIVIENGKIVEDGTHKELVKKDGIYARLWTHQAGGFLQD